MLYEMVCGTPPFLGDDSVAIIGQHINTPPVAPTWHNPECPTALESLIMRLLEKDPTRRPESATQVLQTLETIDFGETSVPTEPSVESPAQPEGQNPIYRHTFVGREAEVRQLHSAFDSTLSGDGSLVMVVGEPGIGKTTICDQLAAYVTLRGGRTLQGNCNEEGSLSLPYLPFVEAMRSYVLERESDELKRELGSGGHRRRPDRLRGPKQGRRGASGARGRRAGPLQTASVSHRLLEERIQRPASGRLAGGLLATIKNGTV